MSTGLDKEVAQSLIMTRQQAVLMYVGAKGSSRSPILILGQGEHRAVPVLLFLTNTAVFVLRPHTVQVVKVLVPTCGKMTRGQVH